jgi:hypothetical protein
VKTVGVVLLIGGACATWLLAGFAKAFIFLFLVLAYIVLGLAEEVLFYRRRRAQERSARQPLVPELPPVPDEDVDEDVLRELGAFDDEPQDKQPAPKAQDAQDSNDETPTDPLVHPTR